jgi:hypothetical protein
VLTTMRNALEDTGGRYGLQVMGVAGGLATVCIVERLNAKEKAPTCSHHQIEKRFASRLDIRQIVQHMDRVRRGTF